MKWKYETYSKWVMKGYDPQVATYVTSLDISTSNLSILDPNLQLFVNLEHIDISFNKLEHIHILCLLPKLKTIVSQYNELTYLPHSIDNLKNLEVLDIKYNRLKFLPNTINKMINLKELDCSFNSLVSMPDNIADLVNLNNFDFSENEITALPQNIHLMANFANFCYSGNPLENISNSTQKVINKNNFINAVKHVNKNSIYNNSQSVHDHNIQKCVKKSIKYVISIKPTISYDQLIEMILKNKILQNDTKRRLFEYINDSSIHSKVNVSFNKLLLHVYSIAINHNDSDEIFKIMDQEINDMECKCFTGRLSRLANCLNGYDDNVKVNISDSERISNVITQLKNNNIGISSQKLKELAREELEDNVDGNVLNEWLGYIDEI